MNKPIFISAGHSNTDPGAVNAITKDREADIVRDMRNMVSYYLTANKVLHVTDGFLDENWPLSRAIHQIGKSKFSIEFHCNASGSPTACGVEALSQAKDKALSQLLCEAISETMNIPLRGDKGWKPENSGQHSRLVYVSNGGIILELFFISNMRELGIWKDKKWLVAKAIATVILKESQK